MKVAVWDTYVKKKDGNVLHFDIVVPEELKDTEAIYAFGKQYLSFKNETDVELNMQECQFCHIEEPTENILADITKQGFHIIEMEEIPQNLPKSPSRRDLILHLRGHYEAYRFANFKEKSLEGLWNLLADAKKAYTPISCNYHDMLLAKATQKEYCKIQYFTEIREFITTNAVIKDVFTKNKEEFMQLATGETIRLDRIVSVNDEKLPTGKEIGDFSCDC
ncbi:MAG: DUF2024 family protein [Raineya sp.]|nr:DUF2024 family protein [Raineya sp.]